MIDMGKGGRELVSKQVWGKKSPHVEGGTFAYSRQVSWWSRAALSLSPKRTTVMTSATPMWRCVLLCWDWGGSRIYQRELQGRKLIRKIAIYPLEEIYIRTIRKWRWEIQSQVIFVDQIFFGEWERTRQHRKENDPARPIIKCEGHDVIIRRWVQNSPSEDLRERARETKEEKLIF